MTSELAVALAKLQTQLPHIKKAAAGTIRNGKPDRYADLADVTKAIMPLLAKHGLCFTAAPTMLDGQFVLDYQLLHISGEKTGGQYPLGTGSPQQIGSMITYARRYCLCAVTGVAPDDDDDDAAAAEAGLDGQVRTGATAQGRSGADIFRSPQSPAPRYRTTGPEHERLRNGTVEPTPDDRPAQRLRPVGNPPVDQWADRGGGPLSVLPAEDQPGSITRQQQRAMHAKFSVCGVDSKDRAGRLGLTIAIIGREVESSNDLSWQEAARLLSELDERARLRGCCRS